MYKGKNILAIIPARGGSKRLPRKNIKDLNGKPLIAWSIEAALQSEVFSDVIVNTDNEEIAEIGRKFGATTPFLRDKNLAGDRSSSIDVLIDTINFFKKKNKTYDVIILLQPTSPLRNSSDIKRALDLFFEKKAASVVSVCEVDHPIQWCNTIEASLSMDNFISDRYIGKRSQDLDVYYRLNGGIYIWDTAKMVSERKVIISPSFAYIMERKKSVDIDDELDFSLASLYMRNYEG